MTNIKNLIDIDDIINKLGQDKEFYYKSPLFHQTVQMIVRGGDLYKIIGDLIVITEDAQEALRQQLLNNVKTVNVIEKKIDFNDDNLLLEHHGWVVECESPFEIRDKDGNFATGLAANIVLDSIKEEYL